MMLRIRQARFNGEPTLFCEGKLLTPWVDELRRAVMTANASVPTGLHLVDVTYVDLDGVELLREFQRNGVEIVACSGFVAKLLEDALKSTTKR